MLERHDRPDAIEEPLVEKDSPVPTSTQELALWIAGALFALSCFGFLPLLGEVGYFDLSMLRSDRLLFGLFHVSVLHNVVHLLLAVGAAVSAGSHRACRRYLAVSGVAMLALVGYGQLDSTPILRDLVPTDAADTALHALLAFTMLVATAARSRKRVGRT